MDDRCERTLLLNSGLELHELVEVVKKIVGKMLDNPDELKFRKIRSNSKVLSTKVLSKSGGRELMAYVGFEKNDDEVDPAVTMKTVDEARLRRTLGHLENVVAVARKNEPRVELALRFPSGLQVKAAFLPEETLSHVLRYVEAYYRKSTEQWIATSRVGTTLKKFDKNADLALTLREAGLAPRAAILFVPADPSKVASAAENAALKARKLALDDEARARQMKLDKDRKLRQDKSKRQRDIVDQRQYALRQFNADREEKTERIEREKQNQSSNRLSATETPPPTEEHLDDLPPLQDSPGASSSVKK